MSKEEVFKLIEEKRAELDKPLEVDPRVEFCKKWADEHKYITMNEFPDLDVYELLAYLFPIVLDNKDIETTTHVSQLFQNFFYYCSAEEVIIFVNIAADIYASGEIDKVIEMMQAPDEDEAKRIGSTIENLDEGLIEDLLKREGYDLEEEVGSDFATILFVLKNHEVAFFDALAILAAHKCVCEKFGEIDNIINKHKDSLRSKDRRKIAEKNKKKLFKLDYALGVANSVSSFVSQKIADTNKMIRSREIKKSKLNDLERILKSSLEREEIVNASEIVNCIDYPDLAIAVLELIREHNKLYYERLEKEYNELNSNDETKYKALLHDFGINAKEYDISKIKHLKIEDIRSILETIVRKYSFTEEKALNILEVSSLERVELIGKYIANGYVSIDYISNNIDLYDTNSDDIEILGNNIDLLSSYNVNPYMFKNSIDVLFSDTDKLKEKVLILKKYDLLKYFKTTDNFSFLLKDNLERIIDKYLEYGFENLLKEDLNILNFGNLKRLDIIHMLNIPIDSVEELSDILGSNKFFMSDDIIDFYLYNAVEYHEKVDFDDSILGEFVGGKRYYNFNGVLVSTNKVKRQLDNGLSLYDSIFDGMIVSEEEYSRVVNCLGQITK